MIKRVQIFLGPNLAKASVAWFAITGLASLVLNAWVDTYEWVRPVQSLIVILFVAGIVIIVLARLAPGERGRWIAVLIPAVIALFLALFIAPQWSTPLLGAAVGWVIAGALLGRSRTPIAYREAIRHLRKNEYQAAIRVMDRVIDEEPNEPNHYRFRAEVFRLWGKLKPAVRDYETMIRLTPESALAHNGLAEVLLQRGDYSRARQAALQANALAPDDWVTFYNLGMIEDRLNEPGPTLEHLEKALALRVPDARHRLLIHLYRLRAFLKLGQLAQAGVELNLLKRQTVGLEEWQTVLKSDQAETLREVIGADVDQAAALMTGELALTDVMRAWSES